MNKRGQAEVWELTVIFEILTALVVAAFFVMSALTFNSYTKFDRIFLEEDMKMMVNALTASPAQIEYNYSHSRMYDIKIKPDEVQVTRNLKIKDIGKKHHLILQKVSPRGLLRSVYYD